MEYEGAVLPRGTTVAAEIEGARAEAADAPVRDITGADGRAEARRRAAARASGETR